MTKKHIFISSVQSEFAEERKRLAEYIRQDALFSRYFEPFLFEELPAQDMSAQGAYLEQAADVKDTIGSMVGNGKIKAMQMVLDKTDADKFRHPEDIDRIMDTIMLLGEGMEFRLENDKDTDYDRIMAEFEDLLRMLKRNFYKEEYL